MPVPNGGNQHLVSGSLSNLQAADGTGHGVHLQHAGLPLLLRRCPSPPARAIRSRRSPARCSSTRMRTDETTDTCGRCNWIPGCAGACAIHPLPEHLHHLYLHQQQPAGHQRQHHDGRVLSHARLEPQTDQHLRGHGALASVCKADRPAAARWRTSPARRPAGTAPLAVTFTDLLDQHSDRVVLDLRRQNSSTVQNPSHTYTSGGKLHRRPHRDQRVRQQHLHEEQLHHRRHPAGGQLLRHADHRHGAAWR